MKEDLINNKNVSSGLMLIFQEYFSFVNNQLISTNLLTEMFDFDQKLLDYDYIKSETRKLIYQYLNKYNQLPEHIESYGDIHQHLGVAQLLAEIMEQEFGIYEIHLNLRSSSTSEELDKQIEQLNQVIKIYSVHNINSVIYITQNSICKELKLLNSQEYGISLASLSHCEQDNCNIPIITDCKSLNRLMNYTKQLCQIGESSKPKKNILIYSKINPATGNQTFALRLKKILNEKYMNERIVYFRGIDQFDQNNSLSCDKEVNILTEFIKKNNIDICFGINVYRTCIILSKVKKYTKFNLISIIAGTDAYEFLQNEITACQMKEACSISTLIVSINEEMKNNFISKLQIAPEKIAVVNQSIDLSYPKSSYDIRQKLGLKCNFIQRKINFILFLNYSIYIIEGDKLILYPAAVREVKNCLFLIEPMKKLLQKYPNHYLVHVGSILDEKYYEQYINELQNLQKQCQTIAHRFLYIGSLDYPSYLNVLTQADLLLNCSLSEGQSNAILEAMGCKILNLVSRIEGNLSICENGKTALMFEGEEEFIQMYESIFERKVDNQQIIENAYQNFLQRYTFEHEAKGYSDILNSLKINKEL